MASEYTPILEKSGSVNHEQPQGQCARGLGRISNFELCGICLLGQFFLLLGWTTYVAQIYLVMHAALDTLARGHTVWFRVTLGLFIAAWASQVVMTLRFLAKKDRAPSSRAMSIARFVSSLLFLRYPFECIVLQTYYRGRWEHIERVREEMKWDLVIRSHLWGIPQAYIQAFVALHYGIYDVLYVGAVTCSVITTATPFGYLMRRNLRVPTGLGVCMMWCSLVGAVLTFSAVTFVWRLASVNFYLIDMGISLALLWLVALIPLRAARRLNSWRELLLLLFLPPLLVAYRTIVPAFLWAYRGAGTARYALLPFLPSLAWRIFALCTAIIYWPLPRTLGASHMVTSMGLLCWVGELLFSIALTMYLRRRMTADEAEHEWKSAAASLFASARDDSTEPPPVPATPV
jgi:hypothetical protein